MMKDNTIKLAILYRVIQHWRAPIFQKIAQFQNVDMTLFYGADFPGSKVVSGKNLDGFRHRLLPTVKITKKFGSSNGRRMPFCPTLFWELLKFRPDIVLTEGSSNFANALQGFIYAKLFRKKIIWWGLGIVRGRSRDSRKDHMVNWFEKHCDAHIVYSSIGRKYYEGIGVPTEKIFTAVNVVNTDQVFEQQKKADYQAVKSVHRPFNVLFVGALQPTKKVDLLIRAFAKLRQKYNDVRLTIVGGGDSLADLKTLRDQQNIPDVTFTGPVIDGVDKYFADADVFVLPGLGGLAVSEAMAHGLPVIASIGDGCEVDLLTPQCGIIDLNLNEESLAIYLAELHDDPERLAAMKTAARNIILERYNVHTYLDQIESALHYVMEINRK